jgi:hypothetical protein
MFLCYLHDPRERPKAEGRMFITSVLFMTPLTSGRALTIILRFVAAYADLVGVLLTEPRYLAGCTLVADRAFAPDLIRVVGVIEGHRAVIGGEFNAISEFSSEGNTCEHSEEQETCCNLFHVNSPSISS